MRYADRVTFVKTTDEQYNPDLGEYTHTEVISITKPCFVMDMGMESPYRFLEIIKRIVKLST
ncbi:phage protein [Streptococcus pyogenes]|nr:phage protein [Streptococcus pyogenes]